MSNLVTRVKRHRDSCRFAAITYAVVALILAVFVAFTGAVVSAIVAVAMCLLCAWNVRLWHKANEWLNSPVLYLAALQDEFGNE